MRVDDYSINSELLMGQLSAFRGPPPGYAVMREFFTYQVPVFSNLAALVGTATNQLLIQADSDFEWVAGAYEFDLAAAQLAMATRQVPNMTIQIQDSGSGRFLSNAAVPVETLFGPGIASARSYPISKIFKANSNVSFTAVNFDAATATGNLRLTLLGWKIYYYPVGAVNPEQLPPNLAGNN